MPPGNKGYDIESRAHDGSIERYIEVKATRDDWGRRGQALTKAEYEFSRRPDIEGQYWLYVVERALGEDPLLYRIKAPFGLIDRYVFDHGWRAVAEGYPQEYGEAGKPSVEDLNNAVDPVKRIARSLADDGYDIPIIGYEIPQLDGAAVEAAWLEQKIAVTIDEDEDRDAFLKDRDWLVFRAPPATAEELAAALIDRGQNTRGTTQADVI